VLIELSEEQTMAQLFDYISIIASEWSDLKTLA
jgi:hypothetical protein